MKPEQARHRWLINLRISVLFLKKRSARVKIWVRTGHARCPRPYPTETAPLAHRALGRVVPRTDERRVPRTDERRGNGENNKRNENNSGRGRYRHGIVFASECQEQYVRIRGSLPVLRLCDRTNTSTEREYLHYGSSNASRNEEGLRSNGGSCTHQTTKATLVQIHKSCPTKITVPAATHKNGNRRMRGLGCK